MSNQITWWEIQVPDLEQAKQFYGGVFGWGFKTWTEDFETATVDDGQMIGGLRQVEGPAAGRGFLACFTCDVHDDERDRTLEQYLAAVEELGGTVVTPRTEIAPEMGWYARVADPTGVVFDLWSGRPPADAAA